MNNAFDLVEAWFSETPAVAMSVFIFALLLKYGVWKFICWARRDRPLISEFGKRIWALLSSPNVPWERLYHGQLGFYHNGPKCDPIVINPRGTRSDKYIKIPGLKDPANDHQIPKRECKQIYKVAEQKLRDIEAKQQAEYAKCVQEAAAKKIKDLDKLVPTEDEVVEVDIDKEYATLTNKLQQSNNLVASLRKEILDWKRRVKMLDHDRGQERIRAQALEDKYLKAHRERDAATQRALDLETELKNLRKVYEESLGAPHFPTGKEITQKYWDNFVDEVPMQCEKPFDEYAGTNAPGCPSVPKGLEGEPGYDRKIHMADQF